MPFGAGVIQHMNYAQTVGTPPVNQTESRVQTYQLEIPLSSVWPQQNRFDWSLLESWLDVWSAGGKTTTVCVKVIPSGQESSPWAASCIPPWMLTQGIQQLQLNYGGIQTWPVLWDPIFQSLYAQFVSAFAQQYDGDPRIEWVLIGTGPFCCSKVVEATLWSDPPSVQAIRAAGYSDAAWFSACREFAKIYASRFQRTTLMFGISEYINRGYNEAAGFDHLTLGNNVASLPAISGGRPAVGLFYHDLRGTAYWSASNWPAYFAALGNTCPIALGLDNAASPSPGTLATYGDPLVTAEYAFGGGSTGLPSINTTYYELYTADVGAANPAKNNYQPAFDNSLTWVSHHLGF
jgi:hypothetical protein